MCLKTRITIIFLYFVDCSAITQLLKEKEDLLTTNSKNQLSIKSLEEMVTSLKNSLMKNIKRIEKLEYDQLNTYSFVEQLSTTQKNILNQLAKTQQSFDEFLTKLQTAQEDSMKLQEVIDIIIKRISKVAKIQSSSETKIKAIVSNYGEESLQITKHMTDFKVSST